MKWKRRLFFFFIFDTADDPNPQVTSDTDEGSEEDRAASGSLETVISSLVSYLFDASLRS